MWSTPLSLLLTHLSDKVYQKENTKDDDDDDDDDDEDEDEERNLILNSTVFVTDTLLRIHQILASDDSAILIPNPGDTETRGRYWHPLVP